MNFSLFFLRLSQFRKTLNREKENGENGKMISFAQIIVSYVKKC